MKKHKCANPTDYSVFRELLWWVVLPLVIVFVAIWVAPWLGVR